AARGVDSEGRGRSARRGPVVRRIAGRLRARRRRYPDRARSPRGERLRVRVPDGAHEPQSRSRGRNGVPRARLRPHLPELEPRARSGPLRRRCVAARAPRGGPGAQAKVREVTFRDALYQRARRARRRIVLPEGQDDRVRAAAARTVGTAPGITTVSGAFYMVRDDVVLTFTDCAVVPEPTSQQLAEAAVAAAHDRRRIVGDEPVVAFLSYSTKGSATGPRVERVRRALELLAARRPDFAFDGELQSDAALVM